jgi:hypothetical protein
MIAATWFLVAVTIPALHPHLLTGIRMVIGGHEVALIVLGFACLAAGITAGALGGRDAAIAPAARPRGTMLGRLAWLMIPLLVIIVSLVHVLSVLGLRPEWTGGAIAGFVNSAFDYLDEKAWYVFTDDPIVWLLVLAVPAAAWGLGVAAGKSHRRATEGVTSFDAAVSTRRSLGQFIGPWLALAAICACALPTCFVVGIVVQHFRLTQIPWP